MPNTFNLKQLSNEVAAEFYLSNTHGSEVTHFIFDRIKAELAKGKQVRLHNFGTLAVRDKAACTARNPTTGESLKLAARRVVKLTASPALKNLLQKSNIN